MAPEAVNAFNQSLPDKTDPLKGPKGPGTSLGKVVRRIGALPGLAEKLFWRCGPTGSSVKLLQALVWGTAMYMYYMTIYDSNHVSERFEAFNDVCIYIYIDTRCSAMLARTCAL